jgi:hypothetical protein
MFVGYQKFKTVFPGLFNSFLIYSEALVTAGACLKFVSDTLDTLEKTYRKEFLSLVGLIVGIKCVNALIRVT